MLDVSAVMDAVGFILKILGKKGKKRTHTHTHTRQNLCYLSSPTIIYLKYMYSICD
jgi:hypothetical protein